MSRMIAFEFRKLLRNRLLLIMTLLFGILNLFRIVRVSAQYPSNVESFRNGYFAVYDEVSGEWDNEKIQYVLTEYKKAKAVVDAGGYSTEPDQPGTHTGYVFGDWGLFEEIRDAMDRLYHYEGTMTALTQRAADYAAFYEEKGNAEQAERNRKIAATYQNRSVHAFYGTLGFERYLKYDFSTLLILFLLLPMLSPLFAREHETGMHGLLYLTPQYQRLPLAKLLAGFLAAAAVSVLFFAEDILVFRYLYPMRGLSQPVYTLPDYFYSPLSCSIGCWLLLNGACKLLCFLVLGSLCAAISAAVKKELVPFGCTAAVTVVLLVTDAYVESPVLSVFNPVTLFWSGRLFCEFRTVSVCGTPVFYFWLPIAAAAAELLLFSALAVLLGKRRSRRDT